MKLTSNDIEKINSLGPYNHSVWRNGNIVITQEEVLQGRADFLVSKIREIITKNFTLAQIQKMSIVDIGCYDGYILQQLTDLPFKKMVGIEPRKKNIDKGLGIRKILHIKEKIIFKRSTLEALGIQKFDIVMCIGVLHHVESVPVAINKLDSICNKMMILENLCIPSVHITDRFKVDIEMKDIIYKNENLCGITGQKFESSYYDGSAASTTVISVPSIETMKMHLISLSHSKITVAASPEDFSKAIMQNTRPSKEVLIYSLKEVKKKSTKSVSNLLKFEIESIKINLSKKLVNSLWNKYILKDQKTINDKGLKKIFNYIDGGSISQLINAGFNSAHFEILKNMKYNCNDKISFEYAKMLLKNNKANESILILKKLIHKINTDWRICYRSFYLLSEIYREKNQISISKKYLKLCISCNSDFPLTSFEAL